MALPGPGASCRSRRSGLDWSVDDDAGRLDAFAARGGQEGQRAAAPTRRLGPSGARETTAKRVLGIAEYGILTALTLGQRFGVILTLAKSVRVICGITPRWGWRSGLASPNSAMRVRPLARMIEIGRRLRDDHGADTIVYYRGRSPFVWRSAVGEPALRRFGCRPNVAQIDVHTLNAVVLPLECGDDRRRSNGQRRNARFAVRSFAATCGLPSGDIMSPAVR